MYVTASFEEINNHNDSIILIKRKYNKILSITNKINIIENEYTIIINAIINNNSDYNDCKPVGFFARMLNKDNPEDKTVIQRLYDIVFNIRKKLQGTLDKIKENNIINYIETKRQKN